MTRSESKSLEKRLKILVGGNDEWVPPFVRECCSVEETAEWRTLNRIETATLKRLYKKPVTDLATCKQEVLDIRAPMLAFEKRMRRKYPNMPETQTEMETRWQNDPEIAAEVAEAMKDDRFLNKRSN